MTETVPVPWDGRLDRVGMLLRPFRMLNRCLRLALAVGMAGGAAVWADEAPRPYAVDAHTLHLWHLDEDAPPFLDAGLEAKPLLGLLNGAEAGHAATPGFGRSVSFHHLLGETHDPAAMRGGILLAERALDRGQGDDVSAPFSCTGPDGAFTFEALVKLDILPQDARGVALGILSMEDDEGGTRVFNFRIEKSGFLAFIPLNRPSAIGGCLAPLPTSGPHALNTSDWFHVAVAYNGREGTAGNLTFYWTRLQPGLRSAHAIGRSALAEDLPNLLGDFAIGNEARSLGPANAEAEPFPGCIDEVRISSGARHPSDFLLVPAEHRRAMVTPAETERDRPAQPFGLEVASVSVDGTPVTDVPSLAKLNLSPGLHRLDFDLKLSPDSLVGYSGIRCQLAGLDERWQTSTNGMDLIVECLGREDAVLGSTTFSAGGVSPNWNTSFEDTRPEARSEAVFVPAGTERLRVRLSSGAPDTTGLLMIDDLDALLPGESGEWTSVWFNSRFSEGESLSSSAGLPSGWQRGGSDPSIARLVTETRDPALALVDADRDHHAEWIASSPLPPFSGSRTLLLKWREAFNVIGGNLHRATYTKVPPGEYTFRAAVSSNEDDKVAWLELPVRIRPPLMERPWFRWLLGAVLITAAGWLVIDNLRRHHRRRLRLLEQRQMLAEDRARIARDMHDDLGTRITLMTLSAALIERDMGENPAQIGHHLDHLKSSARQLVTAMDDLVWSVDPTNDSLKRLGSFITRTADEMFRDAPIRCRLELPPVLPDQPMRSDVRHHLALSVKEALHNVLRHAGPCEASVRLQIEQGFLTVEISDTGRGFDEAESDSGNGLANLRKRMQECGGACEIRSVPGQGTLVRLTLPLTESLTAHA